MDSLKVGQKNPMNTSTLLFAVSLAMPSAFAEQPTLQSLALKIEALERQVASLKADLDVVSKRMVGAVDAAETSPPDFIIRILKNGSIRVEGEVLSDEQLAAKVRSIVKKFPNQPIKIRANGVVKYQDVVRVIDLCQRAAAWNLAFEQSATSNDG